MSPLLVEPQEGIAPLSPDEAAGVFRSHRMFLSTVFDEDLWHMQRQIADALDENDMVAVKACHSSGKTRLAAGLGGSFLARHDDAIVISTAPTWTQVKKLLWGEVHGLVKRARFIKFPTPLDTELKVNEQNYFMGYSTNEAVRFQGWHAPNILVIIDEAPGVDDPIFDAIAGIEAGGHVRILMLGNPVVASGRFYDAFATNRRLFWKLFTISAFDTPNLAGCYYDAGIPETRIAMRVPPPPGHQPVNLAEIESERDPRLAYAPRPYLTTRKWVWKKIIEWGVLSPPFQSRVLGKFPSDSPDALLGLGVIEDAQRTLPSDGSKALDIGIDVAGPGDDETAMVTRFEHNIVHTRAWPGDRCEGNVIAAIRQDEAMYGVRARHVGIDTIGQGHYFANTIEAARVNVTRIVVSNTARGREDTGERRATSARLIYDDYGAQRYWRVRQRFQRRQIGGLTDDITIAQAASLKYEYTPSGKIGMEPKRKRASRGLTSPDRAEALMLSEYCPDLDRLLVAVSTTAGSQSYDG